MTNQVEEDILHSYEAAQKLDPTTRGMVEAILDKCVQDDPVFAQSGLKPLIDAMKSKTKVNDAYAKISASEKETVVDDESLDLDSKNRINKAYARLVKE